MIITYEVENNLYLNITNKCPNSCDFCVRNIENVFEHNLWLEKDPSPNEILKDIFSRNLDTYRQLVFCGFGEPLANIEEVLAVCKEVKKKKDIYIRVNTNGLANKIHNCDVTPHLASLVDGISISLNAKNAEEYDAICHSEFGNEAFPSILDFAKKCRPVIKDVQFSIVDCLPPDDIEACKRIAESLGVKLKIRKLVK